VKQKKILVSPRLNKGKCRFNWVNWAGGRSGKEPCPDGQATEIDD